MRGKRAKSVPNFPNIGITPADAGKTPTTLPLVPIKKDHPRGCGENALSDTVAVKPKGSPPRMRGKRV